MSFRVVFKSGRNLGSFFKYKDSIDKDLRSYLIYKYTCPSCNAGYIGCTNRHFRTRIFEHLGVSARTGSTTIHRASGISKHIALTKHVGTEEDFEILYNPSQKTFLKIVETILIQREQPALNDTSGSYPLRVHPSNLGLEEHLLASAPPNSLNHNTSHASLSRGSRKTRMGVASA